MNSHTSTRALWLQVLRTRAVWVRAAKLGLVVGVLQTLLNQGDHWVHRKVDMVVVAKTILCPLLSFAVAFISIATTQVENLRRDNVPLS
jgi:type III secretory pathway component EscS